MFSSFLSLSSSISPCRSSSKACSTLTLLNFVTAISPIRPIALEEKRKVCVFQQTRLHGRVRERDPPVVFPRLSSWPAANSADFPVLRNGQLRRSSLVGIEFSAEWLLPRSLFNKFSREKSLSSDYPTVSPWKISNFTREYLKKIHKLPKFSPKIIIHFRIISGSD